MTREIYQPLTTTDMVTATLESLKTMEENKNPYTYDSFHSGKPIAKGWEVMFEASSPEPLDHVILCNCNTGQRIKVNFEPQERKLKALLVAVPAVDYLDAPAERLLFDPCVVGRHQTSDTERLEFIDIPPHAIEHNLKRGRVYVRYSHRLFVRVDLFLDAQLLQKTIERELGEFPGFHEHYDENVRKVRVLCNIPDVTKDVPSSPRGVVITPFGLDE